MCDSNGGLYFVDVLSAFPTRSVRVNLQVGWIDIYFYVFDFRKVDGTWRFSRQLIFSNNAHNPLFQA